MPAPDRHFQEELQDLLDQRLDAAANGKVEAHLAICAECQREFAALSWTKTFAAEHFAASAAPKNLEEKIRTALRNEGVSDNRAVIRPDFWQTNRRAILAWAAAIALAAIGAVTCGYFFRPSLPESLARNYRSYEAHALVLESETRDVKQMEIYFDEHDVRFKTRVFDLSMMGYQLTGGTVQRLRGQASALFVYRGPHNHALLCQMYSGTAENLPAGAVRREHNGIVFYRYQINGLTVVFWPEESVMCALISDIAPEKVVELAFAKAVIL